ncbi:uncharacterized protein LOC118338481 [Morone saxatilis]|uniref:uncharacterized protein LOC118338481 n=1 Tax=Morone saxatilis TaxID=34816 RepID=UPI0015E1D6BA|nr:uncharacterized protein LOC118338481 [Morone saxatilis]
MNMFRRDKGSTASTPVVPPRPSKEELDNPITHSLSKQDEGLTAASQKSGVMGVMQKVNPFKSTSQAPSTVSKAPSSESLEQGKDSTQNPGMLKGVMQKVNPFKSTSQVSKAPSSESLEQGRVSDSNQVDEKNPGMFKGVLQKVNPFKPSTQVPKSDPEYDSADPPEAGKELQDKQNPGMIAGMMQKVNPFKSSQPKDPRPLNSELSSSDGSLADNNNVPEKQNPGMFKGMMQKVNPFKSYTQMPDEECQTDSAVPASSLKTQVRTFRIRRILPNALFGSGTKDSGTASSETAQETVEVQTLEMAEVPVPSEGTVLDPLDDEDGLLAWWRTVEGWEEWNEANQNDEAEEVVEEAADRVFMAARLFVRFFNQRGASLQQRILELLSLADAADIFHKKTVTASVGGGVASLKNIHQENNNNSIS